MKTDKYIFLDIDGVMNHERWLHQAHLKNLSSPEFWFDPVCVDRLNKILSETGAKLVISSSWRSDSKLKAQFQQVGIHSDFDRPISMGQARKLGYTIRGEEIDHYLKEHGIDVHSRHQYVILDDDNDFTPWQRKNTLFRVAASMCDEPYNKNGGSGLTEELAQKIIKYLNEKS